MPEQPPCLCPKYCRAAELLGKRWTCLILSILLTGPRRFSELETQIPRIGGRMLSERLKELETCGVVERRTHDHSPARVDYFLTSKGNELRPVINEMHSWADRWEPARISASA